MGTCIAPCGYMAAMRESAQRSWIRTTAVLAAVSVVALIAGHTARVSGAADLQAFAKWFEPHRGAWYAMPVVMAAFGLLGLAMVPVLLLIVATGVAFGPLLGPIYAMGGCLASASLGFAIGRLAGPGPVQRVGGHRVAQVIRSLERNGTLAVFLLRKVPAPFLIANMVAGASNIRYRDFVIGTVLGMGALVVALAGFGYQLINVLHAPSPTALLGAAILIGVPLTLAWLINRALRQPEQPS